ncbi:tRNA selenocysteine 1-associated protein 1-like [Xenia sp. Carnegie-2017]|uniref:tRNA selenocysteine 1-associated protein 1-like n=1 Tax=Xenia sp. Carnegie-2017 TaxID=2897299 RepID=UPI001F04940E|nr:tRNA selenocysteine 1-associated protein 1-like [Xenia sp. Carnegie-2017]
MSTLWMGDLEPYMNEQFVRAAFVSAGHAVTTVKVIINKLTGGPAGYCFVDFPTSKNAENALNTLNGVPVPGTNPPKRFKLNWASYGKDNQTQGPEYSVFVGDLTAEVDDPTLLKFFRDRYPSCKAAKVVMDSSGMSRGYGFVRFGEESEQKRAMIEMQGIRGCGGKPIRVSVATPKKPTTVPLTGTTTTYPTTTQQYLQQYQQYQQYYAAWQASYQQQAAVAAVAAQYYPGYSQYAQTYDQQQQVSYEQTNADTTVPVTATEAYQEEAPDLTLQEYDEDIDVAAANKEYMEREEALYYEMEASRWQPLDPVTGGPGSLVA